LRGVIVSDCVELAKSAKIRAELDAFRRTHNELRQQAATIGEIKTIDWAYYSQNIKSVGLVDSFKKATETLAPQTMTNPFTAELEENFAALMKEAEEAKTFSEGQILELEAKLKEMDTVGDIKGVTMAEETAKYPELVAEIEEEINNHEWFK